MAAPYTAIAYAGWAVLLCIWLPGYLLDEKARRTPHVRSQLLVTTLIVTSFILLFSGRVRSLLGGRIVPTPEWLAVCGDVLCWVAVLFAIWARLTLGRNWSGALASVKDGHELVQSGPYAVVRHPIYTGFLFAMLGTAVTIGAVAGYLAVGLGLVAFQLRIRIEEDLLTGEFPEAYPAYKQRTAAFIPLLW